MFRVLRKKYCIHIHVIKPELRQPQPIERPV